MGGKYYKFSVIVCTCNRVNFLKKCLDTIFLEMGGSEKVELIIVDNNSIDNTKKAVKKLTYNLIKLKYIKEERQGLSFSKNHGFEHAQGEWVIYIDDDAKLKPNYFNRLNFIISNFNFDCFGGMYFAWFPYGRPAWLPKGFGDKIMLRDDIGLIDGTTGWLSGGNMVIKKSVLEVLGGFRTDLGMKGGSVGYGEEEELQQRLMEQGYKIGFDPELSIDHAVLPHKFKVSWHLKRSFALGRDGRYSKYNSRANLYAKLLKVSLGAVFKHLPLRIYKLVFDPNYYYQSLIIDLCHPVLWHYGALRSKRKE